MSKVLLCMGTYAAVPYLVERVYINVYSIEELCYCLTKSVYLIDQEIMDKKLINWIKKECGLQELAAELTQVLKKEGTVDDFVKIILEFVGYCTMDEIEQTKESLKDSVSLNVYEKKKARADYFAGNKKYVLALKSYDILLEELPEIEKDLKSKIYHNRGVVYTGLFQFESAMESFKQAFECDGAEESYTQYLAASRMCMEESEYVNFVAKQTQEYGLALQVEKMMENVEAQFEGTEENRMLFTLKVCKEEKNTVSYYEEIEHITSELKEKYREIVAQ